MHQISATDEFLKIELQGDVDYEELAQTIVEEINYPGYSSYNDLWLLNDCVLNINAQELDRVWELIYKIYPQDASRDKTAIVSSPGLNAAFVSLWASQASAAPFAVELFTNISDAEAWLRK